MKKKLLAYIMTVCMLTGLLPMTAAAAESDPVLGASDGYETTVSDEEELNEEDESLLIGLSVNPLAGEEGPASYDLAENPVVIEEAGEYIITQTGEGSTTNTITVDAEGDVEITLNGVSIDVSEVEGTTAAELCAFAILSGDVTVMLQGENTLKSGKYFDADKADVKYDYEKDTAYAGLWVKKGAELTIDGEGKLTATGAKSQSGGGAGIGGSYIFEGAEGAMGDINIKGGTIIATGGNGPLRTGAGIGKATGDSNSVTITISDGDVTANGYGQSAGIGGTYSAGKGKIYITGGKVTATANARGSGIGAGNLSNWDLIDISGGEVTAEAKVDGAGIGRAASHGWSTSSPKMEINISDGTVEAKGTRYGAGIGGGGTTDNDTKRGYSGSADITISGGTVTATGGTYAAGIGSGSFKEAAVETDKNAGVMETITLKGGKITATNGKNYNAGQYTLDDSLVTGIGQGLNPGADAQAAYENWNATTADGAAMELIAKGNVASLTRNGESFTAAVMVIGGTEYYLLPEGYYNLNNGTLVASTEDEAAADDLAETINNLIANLDDAEAAKKAISDYDALSASLQYYVGTIKGADVDELKEALKNSNAVQTSVTLNAGEGTLSGNNPVTATYGSEVAFGVPVRQYYDFVGWYNGETAITGADGICAEWDSVDETATLTAKWASEIKGEGTEDDPYVLTKVDHLVMLSHISFGMDELVLFGENATKDTLMSAHYQLSDNWDDETALKTKDNAAGTFYGITGFKGVFDGNGKTINLAINTNDPTIITDANDETTPATTHATRGYTVNKDIGAKIELSGGLFRTTTDATIKNLTTTGTVTLLVRETSAGVIVGDATNTTFENVTNEASFKLDATDNTAWAGAIAGTAKGSTAVFTDCQNTGNVTSGFEHISTGNSAAAGICGYMQAADVTLEGCSNTGAMQAKRNTDVAGRFSYAAGMVGTVAETTETLSMENCSNTGDLQAVSKTGNTAAGLLISANSTLKLTVKDCSNAGSVEAKDGTAAILVGTKSGLPTMPVTTYEGSNVHKMTGSGDYVFGSDNAEDGVLEIPVEENVHNFYDADRFVKNAAGAKASDICSANGHEVYNELGTNENISDADKPFQTWGTAYVIETAADYENLVKAIKGDAAAQTAVLGNALSGSNAETKALALASAYVKLGADITLTDLTDIGLGTAGNPFTGKIDGQQNTVTYALKDTALAGTAAGNIAFIGESRGAEIKNMNFAGSIDITTAATNSNNLYVAAAVAAGSGALVENCHSTVTYDVTHLTEVKNATGGYAEVAGLVSNQSAATVKDSSHAGDISVVAKKRTFAGGIASTFTGTITNCRAQGNITADLQYDSNMPIYGEDAYAGGIAAYIGNDTTITNCTAAGKMIAKNTATTTQLEYNYAGAGGLAGYVLANAAVTFENCAAFTTVDATAVKTVANATTVYATTGAFVGKLKGTATVTGTAWSVNTAAADSGNVIDTTVLREGICGDVKTLFDGELPAGITMTSDVATLDKATGKVTYTAAGSGDTVLKWNGTEFFSVPLTVAANALGVTANDYSGVYDGQAHGITMNLSGDGITVTYGTVKGEYSDAEITRTDAGTTTVYWKAEKDGVVVESSALIQITPAPLVIELTTSHDSVKGAKIIELTTEVKGLIDDVDVIVTLDPDGLDAADLGNGDFEVRVPNRTATYTFTVTADAGENYAEASDSVEVTAKKKKSDDDSSTGGSSSSTATEYDVNKDQSMDNGSIKLDTDEAKEGDTVTFTVKPDAGFEVGKVTVTDEDGNKIKVKLNSDGTYSFTMPASEVEIEVEFNEIEEEIPETKPAAPAEEGVAQESIALIIGNVVAMVDGMPVVNDVAPVIRADRTMLPIRFVAEALGADVSWNEAEQKVTITKGDAVIEIFIGQPFALVNGQPVQLDAPAFIENGRTYLPLRFVAEALGATVNWDANTNTVTIIPGK